MASKTIPAKKQQGVLGYPDEASWHDHCANRVAELQATYSNYKNTLQQLAQKIGDVEQEAEEHK